MALSLGPKTKAFVDNAIKATPGITILQLLQLLMAQGPAIFAIIQSIMSLFTGPVPPAPAPAPHLQLKNVSEGKTAAECPCKDSGSFLTWLEGLVAGNPLLAGWVAAGLAWLEALLPAAPVAP